MTGLKGLEYKLCKNRADICWQLSEGIPSPCHSDEAFRDRRISFLTQQQLWMRRNKNVET